MKRKGIKGFGAILLAVIMAITVFPTTVVSAANADVGEVWISIMTISDPDKCPTHTMQCGSGTAVYDPDTTTLTPTNATITPPSNMAALDIGSPLTLNIILVGENEINGGVYAKRNTLLVFSGAGSLTINAGEDRRCIDSFGSVAIDNTTLTLNSGLHGIDIEGSLTIRNGAKVISNSTTTTSLIGRDGIVISDSTVNAVSLGEEMNAIYSPKGMKISNSDITAESFYPAVAAADFLTINNSTINATSKNDAGIFTRGSLTIENGSNVTASSYYPALICNDVMTIADSKVKATAENDSGIWSRNTLAITGDSDVTANGIGATNGVTVTPKQGSLVEIKTGPSEETAVYIQGSPFDKTTNVANVTGYFHSQTHIHTGGTATCQAKAVCTGCGREYGEILAHSFTIQQQNETGHWNKCENCDATDAVTAHTFKWVIDQEATTTAVGSKHEECEICGYQKAAVSIPATGSSDSNTDNTKTDVVSPQTGDNSNIALWVILMLIAGAGVTGMVFYRQKSGYDR